MPPPWRADLQGGRVEDEELGVLALVGGQDGRVERLQEAAKERVHVSAAAEGHPAGWHGGCQRGRWIWASGIREGG